MIQREGIEKRIRRIPELEAELSVPATAANQRKYRQLLQEHSILKRLAAKAHAYYSLQEELEGHRQLLESETTEPELKAMAREELESLRKKFARAELELVTALLPPRPEEDRNAIVEIRAGTGGDEAGLFAGDLYRQYVRYAERRGWKTEPIDASPGDLGGFKEIIFAVKGPGAYGVLQYESGGHRVQRIPVTESSGRIHTSAATVAVFPEVEPEDDIELSPDELRIDIFCSSGPGGQSVNTTYSAVRITHLPTGLVAQSQDERSQHRNKEKALAVLKARILDSRRRAEEDRMGVTRRSLTGSGDRSERIRTYNFPQNRLTDHRINLTLYSLNNVIDGDLDEVMSALRDHDIRMRLERETGAPAEG